MRPRAKHCETAYSSSYPNRSASTDEHYTGSGWGNATIPPRPPERLHSDGQFSIRAASPPHRRAGYGG
jgi:hypothetical protein